MSSRRISFFSAFRELYKVISAWLECLAITEQSPP
jgi:hypothetical protein